MGGGGGHSSSTTCGPYGGCKGSGKHYRYGWLQKESDEALESHLEVVKESLLENDGWGGCSAHHVSFYCAGSTGISCCHRNGLWSQCGSTGHHHNCMGGGGGHSSHTSCGVYGCRHSGTRYHYGWLQKESDEALKSQLEGVAESLLENDGWGGCSAHHTSFYCAGSTGISCCKRNGVWSQCGSVGRHHNCMGGGGGRSSSTTCGPYGCKKSGSRYHFGLLQKDSNVTE